MLRGVGRVSSTSRVSTVCLVVDCTSTSGDAPETVIVSSSAPTFSSALTVAVKSVDSCDAFALDGREAGQREGHRVGAGAQVDDLVLAGAVGERGRELSR